jgi:hypothetical protein
MIEDDPARLRVTLDTGSRTEVVTAAYVGAGGGHGVTPTVREHLVGDLWRSICGRRRKVGLPCQPNADALLWSDWVQLFSPLPDDRWLIFVNCDEADTRRELPTAAALGVCSSDRRRRGVERSPMVSYFRMQRTVEA